MWLLAEEVAEEAAKVFHVFDLFMFAFTVLIAIGLYRMVKSKEQKSKFALGFTTFCLLVFLAIDALIFLTYAGVIT